MGSNKSKPIPSEQLEKHEAGSAPSTPILTPKTSRESIEEEHLDPRSPSRNISRTPIELLSAVAEKLQTLNVTENNHVLTPLKTHMFLGVDPRSPTLDIQRTPIVVSASPEKKLPDKIRNKNLDKVRKAALLGTPKIKVAPKLIDSTPITPKTKPETKRESLYGLLETNIDFTETDLDVVLKTKYLANHDDSLTLNDPRSPTTDFVRTPLQISKCNEKNSDKLDEPERICQPVSRILDIVQYEDIIEVKKLLDIEASEVEEGETNKQASNEEDENTDPDTEDENHTVTKNYKLIQAETVLVEEKFETIIIEQKDVDTVESAPLTPMNPVNITPKKIKSVPVTPTVIDLTADVKELDKKLTNLIYEDEDLVVCPRVVKLKEQNRTPLGIRNGNQEKQYTRKLKVSDKPRNIESIATKIPIFKEKKIKVIQCENTPPRSMKNGKPKKSQWDPKDDTIII